MKNGKWKMENDVRVCTAELSEAVSPTEGK